MGYLGVLVEWIYQDQVDAVLRDVAGHVSSSCSQVGKMGAAFDSHSLRVEANILKLIKVNKADKLLIWHEINDILPLIIELKNILYHDLGVSKIVAYARQIGLQLVEHVGLPLDDVVRVAAVDVPHRLGQLRGKHSCLVPCGDAQVLEDLVHLLGHLVPSEVDPHVILGHDVRDRDSHGHHLAFLLLMVQSNAVGLYFVVLYHVVEHLVLDVRVP